MKFDRISLLTAAVALPALLIGMASQQRVGAQPPTQSDPSVLAPQKYKNIKVLKTLPADQLIVVMRNWNASLGVKCDYCHVINADHTGFELDDKKPKKTARLMVTMTQSINKTQKSIRNRATCYLCHHGQPEPETKPGMGTEPGK